MSRWTGLVVVLAALAALGTLASRPSWAKAASGTPYTIGAIFSVTGDASSLGVPEKNTAAMLESAINAAGGVKGHPVRIVIEDDRGDPAEALNAAKRLVERDKVLAIVGPTRTGTTLAIKDYMTQAKVPLISCAAGVKIVEPLSPWVFKTPQSDRMAVERIISYLKSKKISRVGTISDNTSFGQGGLDELRKFLPKAKITIVDSEEYGPKDPSMESQIIKLRASKPQAVICWGTPPGPAIVAKNMRQLALKVPLICSHGVANDTFLRLAGTAANGVVLPAGRLLVYDQIPATHPQRKVLMDYAARYRKTYGQAPDTFGGHAWDAVFLVTGALAKTGPDRAKLRAQLEHTKGFVGTGGIFTFSAADHNGLTPGAFEMVQVVDGKWKLLR